jgi:caffeoyl-CoA O-methyltransferase
MTKLYGSTETKIVNYVESVFQPEDAILKEARERADKMGLPSIQVGKVDRLHLEVITAAIGAKKAVEIGTLGGYSGSSIVRGMGPTGKLYTFELEQSHADVALETFRRGGVAEQIEILVGPASENLDKITQYGPFDLVFIDADKTSYPLYLKWAAENLRVGGTVLGDNTFAWGMIADEKFESAEDKASVMALREFNQTVAQGGRFRATILPTGEGLTFAVKIK